MKVNAYKAGSKSARLIRDLVRNIKSDYVINWGTSGEKILNPPPAVAKAINKLRCFETLKAAGVKIPEYTTDDSTAKAWLAEGKTVYARKVLCGKGGEGIEIIKPGYNLVRAKLYTKKVVVDREYRVHVMNGQPFLFQKKILVQGRRGEGFQFGVRNIGDGWVFTSKNVECPEVVSDMACKAVVALGLDFGAVDIAYTKKGNAVVFEVNTAPGVQEVSSKAYADAFRRNYA